MDFYNHVDNFKGELIRDNETYQVIDNETLKHLTLSKTILYPGKNTNGHSHPGKEEIYYFIGGHGFIQLDEYTQNVKSGDVIMIKDGMFHKVYNNGDENLIFICVFEKYQR